MSDYYFKKLQRAFEHIAMPAAELYGLNKVSRKSVPARYRVKHPRRAAVLITILAAQSAVVFTQRSEQLTHHPGQVSLPGGGVDANDANLAATALREANEEIALPQAAVEVMGQLPLFTTVTNFEVTPVIGWVNSDVTLAANPNEVAAILTVPLTIILDLNNFKIKRQVIAGQTQEFWVLDYCGAYIWGATAAMLYGFSQQVNNV